MVSFFGKRSSQEEEENKDGVMLNASAGGSDAVPSDAEVAAALQALEENGSSLAMPPSIEQLSVSHVLRSNNNNNASQELLGENGLSLPSPEDLKLNFAAEVARRQSSVVTPGSSLPSPDQLAGKEPSLVDEDAQLDVNGNSLPSPTELKLNFAAELARRQEENTADAEKKENEPLIDEDAQLDVNGNSLPSPEDLKLNFAASQNTPKKEEPLVDDDAQLDVNGNSLPSPEGLKLDLARALERSTSQDSDMSPQTHKDKKKVEELLLLDDKMAAENFLDDNKENDDGKLIDLTTPRATPVIPVFEDKESSPLEENGNSLPSADGLTLDKDSSSDSANADFGGPETADTSKMSAQQKWRALGGSVLSKLSSLHSSAVKPKEEDRGEDTFLDEEQGDLLSPQGSNSNDRNIRNDSDDDLLAPFAVERDDTDEEDSSRKKKKNGRVAVAAAGLRNLQERVREHPIMHNSKCLCLIVFFVVTYLAMFIAVVSLAATRNKYTVVEPSASGVADAPNVAVANVPVAVTESPTDSPTDAPTDAPTAWSSSTGTSTGTSYGTQGLIDESECQDEIILVDDDGNEIEVPEGKAACYTTDDPIRFWVKRCSSSPPANDWIGFFPSDASYFDRLWKPYYEFSYLCSAVSPCPLQQTSGGNFLVTKTITAPPVEDTDEYRFYLVEDSYWPYKYVAASPALRVSKFCA